MIKRVRYRCDECGRVATMSLKDSAEYANAPNALGGNHLDAYGPQMCMRCAGMTPRDLIEELIAEAKLENCSYGVEINTEADP